MTEVELYKPNELIGAIDQIEVSRTAKHLLNFFLQYAQQQIKFHDHKGFEFEVDVSQINGLADIHRTDYETLKKSLIKLIQPVILRDDPQCFSALAPITSVNIDVPRGLYKFGLHQTVIELLRSTDYFTKLQLSEFNPLQSKHSLVLYEWLKRYEKAPKIPLLSIEELRKITGTADKKTYDNYTNIRDKILNVAVGEINEHTPYEVSYTTIKTRAKTRNKVTSVQFEFKHKETKATQENTKVVKQDDWESDIIRCLGMRVPSDAMYETLCEKYITENFCSSKEEFYKATYDYHFKILERFYNEKKSYKHHPNKLQNWLYKDKNKKGLERQQYHYQYIHRLIDNVPDHLQHYVYDAQNSMGMGSLIQKLRTLIGETSTIDLESYL